MVLVSLIWGFINFIFWLVDERVIKSRRVKIVINKWFIKYMLCINLLWIKKMKYVIFIYN